MSYCQYGVGDVCTNEKCRQNFAVVYDIAWIKIKYLEQVRLKKKKKKSIKQKLYNNKLCIVVCIMASHIMQSHD